MDAGIEGGSAWLKDVFSFLCLRRLFHWVSFAKQRTGDGKRTILIPTIIHEYTRRKYYGGRRERDAEEESIFFKVLEVSKADVV